MNFTYIDYTVIDNLNDRLKLDKIFYETKNKIVITKYMNETTIRRFINNKLNGIVINIEEKYES